MNYSGICICEPNKFCWSGSATVKRIKFQKSEVMSKVKCLKGNGTPSLLIAICLQWDCCNETRFTGMAKMSFMDPPLPRGGLKIIASRAFYNNLYNNGCSFNDTIMCP